VKSNKVLRFGAALALALAAWPLGAAGPEDGRAEKLVRAARTYVELKISYDGSYRVIPYPNGDPGEGIGVCTDLVVRSYRALGIDLQALVHQDMKKNFDAYPSKKRYGLAKPDPNIDHRRVPNLLAFLNRHSTPLTVSIAPDALSQWRAGDIVIFDLYNNGAPTHIGIVSDRHDPASGRPLVIHHFPPYPTEDDVLPTWKIIAHFRYFPAGRPGQVQD
jgi:uncharacterized protein